MKGSSKLNDKTDKLAKVIKAKKTTSGPKHQSKTSIKGKKK